MLRVAFLWHLHQPDYRDPLGGDPDEPDTASVPAMPWVRLHALRGYRDMVIETHEGAVPWTLNVVPSLLDQLDHYARGGADRHLLLTRKPADSLTEADHRRMRETFVAGHPGMRREHADWLSLADRVQGGAALDEGAWRDLQVWSTLQWFGATARRDHPALAALVVKGRGFDEADKAAMLAAHDAILAEIPTWWSRDVPFSASAYHHPILPLLVDLGHAQRAMPDLPLDVDFRWPQDARRQLDSGRRRVGEVTGRAPAGLWPSEGAVSPEILPLVAAAGFRWLCSDEHVLARSRRTTDSTASGPWDLGRGLVGWFRDTELSDEIGFRCAELPADEAARRFVDHLQQRHRDGTVLIALDGENPWETFPDAGAAFRQALLARLAEAGIELVTLDAASVDTEPVGRVERLHSGSWIGADYAVWVGDAAARRAWALLARARRQVEALGLTAVLAARPHLDAAEGSDWFWWFGERFSSSFDGRFDALFRRHLTAAYLAAGAEVPAELAHPVGHDRRPVRVEPTGWVPPPPWRLVQRLATGRLPLPGGSMARGQRGVVHFGWTPPGPEQALWVELVGDGQLWLDDRPQPAGPVRAPGLSTRVQVQVEGVPAWPEPVPLAPPEAGRWWGP